MPATIAAARAGATTGEWARTLREVFGELPRADRRRRGGRGAAADETSTSCARRSSALSEALGRRPKILVGKPGLDGHSNGAEQIAVRARDVGHGRRLRGHPPDARRRSPRQRAAGGRPRDRPVDPLGLAPRADPGRDRRAARGGRRRAGRRRRDHPRAATSRRCGRRASPRSTRPRTSTSRASCATSWRSWAAHDVRRPATAAREATVDAGRATRPPSRRELGPPRGCATAT